MQLVVRNKIITEPIFNILKQIKAELHNRKLKQIVMKGDNIAVTCPVHNNGNEKHPSCQIYIGNELTEYGKFNCFTCKTKGTFPQFVNACFDEDDPNFGEEWLLERYGNAFIQEDLILPVIDLSTSKNQYISEKILEQFKYYHPYMFERKLTKDIINKFKIGYDKQTDSIVFPVWDENNNLVNITKRNVHSKIFNIEKEHKKPIYLLNFIKQEDYPFVIVCESQLDALTSWVYGVPAVALMGTGTQYQYDILNKCPIRNYITFFDNDAAGKQATFKFNKAIRKDVFVTNLFCNVRDKKDINDMTQEEFDKLLTENGFKFRVNQ